MAFWNFKDEVKRVHNLHFYDDDSFEFRQLEIVDAFMVQKNKDGEVTNGWRHFLNNMFPFPGYKNIPAGRYTLSYPRDVVLDPYGIIKPIELPDKGSGKVLKVIDWLVDIGIARRNKIIQEGGKLSTHNLIATFLGIGFVAEIFIIAIEVLMKRGG